MIILQAHYLRFVGNISNVIVVKILSPTFPSDMDKADIVVTTVRSGAKCIAQEKNPERKHSKTKNITK